MRFSYPQSDWSLEIDSFGLYAGEVLSVIGPNGSGKSTLLRILAGLLTPKRGTVRLNGRPMDGMRRREIAKVAGYLPQYFSSDFNFRAAEIIAMGRYARLGFGGFLGEDDCRVIQSCMEVTDTARLADRRVFQLSGGEKQRVFLASALAQEPSALLLDEPTSALDLHHQVRFLEIVRELAARDIAVMVVTHDINLASQFCTRMALLENGRLVREGGPAEVLSRETIAKVYGDEIILSSHPESGRPVVFPRHIG